MLGTRIVRASAGSNKEALPLFWFSFALETNTVNLKLSTQVDLDAGVGPECSCCLRVCLRPSAKHRQVVLLQRHRPTTSDMIACISRVAAQRRYRQLQMEAAWFLWSVA